MHARDSNDQDQCTAQPSEVAGGPFCFHMKEQFQRNIAQR